jgi:hypothetical protein
MRFEIDRTPRSPQPPTKEKKHDGLIPRKIPPGEIKIVPLEEVPDGFIIDRTQSTPPSPDTGA